MGRVINAPTDSLWESSASETFSSSTLQEHIEAELVIIGGGYTGLSAALAAAERGVKVVLVEAHQIGFGGSGRNVGLVNAGLWLPPEDINEAIGQTVGQRLTNILGSGPELVFGLIDKYNIACEPVRAGTLHCAHNSAGLADLQKRCNQMQAIGVDVALLTAEETQARIGAKRLLGSLFDPRAGTIQPLAYARGLARAAVEAGAQIFEGTPALSLGWEADQWEIATPSGYVRAPAMLLATNAYPFRMSWVHPLKTVPVSYFQVSTAPLNDAQRAKILPGGEGCWDSAMVMSSWRLDG
ncbi:MAG: FAD-dependent oxidoreductase, partial [Paracoccaceae bacterium]|nr:FAD-dependent oxidoreductase [Paracoccaceae bacterium]